MSKVNIAVIVLFTILKLASSSINHMFTSDRILLAKNSRFRPLVVKTYDQLYFVSFPTYPEPKIKFEPEKISYAPCEIGFESMHSTEYPIGIDSLANGKLVLSLLGVKKIDLQYYVTSLIVNLDGCKSNSTTTFLNVSSAVAPEQRNWVTVLTGEDEFDVFVMGHSKCGEDKACRLRYNETGSLTNATEFDRFAGDNDFKVNLAVEKDLSRGYFFSVFQRNSTTVLRLDENLRVENEIDLPKAFLHSDINGYVTACQGRNNHELECELVDEKFTNHIALTVDSKLYKKYMRSIRMFNLPDGNALILLVLQLYDESGVSAEFSTYIQRVDVYGNLSRPAKFQEDICKDFSDITLTEMMDNFFCISVSCSDSVRTKCVVYRF